MPNTAIDFSPERLRARFAELQASKAAIVAVSAPLREQRDELAATVQPKIESLTLEIADAERGLFNIDQEAAMIVRALGGKMVAPEAEPAAE